MEKTEAIEWLESIVSDTFMGLLFYDRKEDEDMDPDDLRKLMDDGVISKEDMIRVFTAQINREY
jgi:hypothetical protein